MTVRKGPAVDDADLQSVIAWVEDSFEEVVADSQDNIQSYQIALSYAEPTRPREGLVAYADGTKWNPGSGSGPYYYGSDGVWHFMRTPVTPSFIRNYKTGLQISTTAGSATFGVAAGQAADSTNVASMVLASAFTKTTGAWAAGTGNGALDAGTIAASTWYHFFLIEKTDFSAADIVISTSLTPALAAGWTLSRRIGSRKTDSAGTPKWAGSTQIGDEVRMAANTIEQTLTQIPAITAQTMTFVGVPNGVSVEALFHFGYQSSAGTACGILFSALSEDDVASFSLTGGYNGSLWLPAGNAFLNSDVRIRTNTSAQFRWRATNASAGANTAFYSYGWIDSCGQ